MFKFLFLGSVLLTTGCINRVQVVIPAAPVVRTLPRSVAVVSDSSDCHTVADQLAKHLRAAKLEVHPNAEARVTLYACSRSWSLSPDHTFKGYGQALAALSFQGETTAHVVGATAQALDTALGGSAVIRHRRRFHRILDQDTALDLAEQIIPVPLPIRRKVYAATSPGSAKFYHNFAVEAEQEGRLGDALWWAQRAHEQRPSKLHTRYVDELSRRATRTGATPF